MKGINNMGLPEISVYFKEKGIAAFFSSSQIREQFC